jgi:glycosyltransferase involved in cell wall biosynthesis
MISVIIPTYNRMRSIGRAVQSVLDQTFQNFEIIVVDDGSSDATDELLKSFNDPRIHILKHLQNQGASAARNTGMKEAKGDYIAFLDSDDAWYPQKLQVQYNYLKQSSATIGGCVTHFNLVYPKRKKIERHFSFGNNFFYQSLHGCHCAPGSTLMFKKECLSQVGYQNETLKRLEDWEWQIRFSRFFKWDVIPEILSDVYAHSAPPFTPARKALNLLEKETVLTDKKSKRIFKAALAFEGLYLAMKHRSFFHTIRFFIKGLSSSGWIFTTTILKTMCRKIHEIISLKTNSIKGKTIC